MESNTTVAIAIVIFGIVITSVAWINHSASVEKAKAGLQECVEEGIVLWKKECKE